MSAYYNNKKIEVINCPTVWPASEPDYSTYQNLLSGLDIYSVSELLSMPEQYRKEPFNSPETCTKLTDGIKNTDNKYTSSEWFHFTNGNERTIIFRFPHLCAVDKVVIGFLRDDNVAVRLPRKLFVSLSENGSDWQVICRDSQIHVLDPVARCEKTAHFGSFYKALYVKIKFEVSTHCYCDQIEIFGTKEIPCDAKSVVGEEETDDKLAIVNKYPDYSQFLGVHNVLLSYNCLPEDRATGDAGKITVEQYLPHVAYIDRNGAIKDTFFDAFLYLPYTAFNYSDAAKTAAGWHYYIDNVFSPGRNFNALEQATGIVKEKLGLPDYKVKVFFSILYTFPTSESFGDLAGDGKNLNFHCIEDRKAAVKWTVDEYIKRYNALPHNNTELGGFYWFEEFIAYADPHEIELISFARDYLHSLGYKIFWIPYYQSAGFSDWKELGFDIACMQPNYAFNKTIPVERLYDNAEITKMLGMCVELESNGVKDPLDIEKFKQYFDCGAETGYMHSIKMYYQGGVPGEIYRSFVSEDEYVRSVYEDTYLFAKEKYVSRKLR